MKQLLRFISVPMALLFSTVSSAQQVSISNSEFLYSTNPTSLSIFEGMSNEQIIEEIERRKKIPPSEVQTLDSNDIDSLILQRLYLSLKNDRRVTSARLDFSEAQASEMEEILLGISELAIAQSASGIDAMCARWLVSSIPIENKIEDSLDAYNIGEERAKEVVIDGLDATFEKIYEVLGTANSLVFDDFMTTQRERMGRTRVTNFAQNVRKFGNAEATIKHHCEGE